MDGGRRYRTRRSTGDHGKADRARTSRSPANWRIAIQAGLVPVSLGLIGASAFVLARTADHNVIAGILTAVTALIAFATRINPLWIFAAGGALGLTGWL